MNRARLASALAAVITLPSAVMASQGLLPSRAHSRRTTSLIDISSAPAASGRLRKINRNQPAVPAEVP